MASSNPVDLEKIAQLEAEVERLTRKCAIQQILLQNGWGSNPLGLVFLFDKECVERCLFNQPFHLYHEQAIAMTDENFQLVRKDWAKSVEESPPDFALGDFGFAEHIFRNVASHIVGLPVLVVWDTCPLNQEGSPSSTLSSEMMMSPSLSVTFP